MSSCITIVETETESRNVCIKHHQGGGGLRTPGHHCDDRVRGLAGGNDDQGWGLAVMVGRVTFNLCFW